MNINTIGLSQFTEIQPSAIIHIPLRCTKWNAHLTRANTSTPEHRRTQDDIFHETNNDCRRGIAITHLLSRSCTERGQTGRQTWLQHLPPDQVPECGPGLDYMLEVFPFQEAISMILKGSGECAEVQWTFLSLSIAEWSLVCFSAIIIATIVAIFKLKPGS